jgi:hypothetical protein
MVNRSRSRLMSSGVCSSAYIHELLRMLEMVLMASQAMAGLLSRSASVMSSASSRMRGGIGRRGGMGGCVIVCSDWPAW